MKEVRSLVIIWSSSEKLQLKALAIVKELENEPELASVLRHLGHVASQLANDDYEKYYFEALQLAKMHRLAPVGLDVLIGLSEVNAQNGKTDEPIELLTLVAEHPCTTHETRVIARDALELIAAKIEDEQFSIAQEHGRELELWEAVETILTDA